MYAHYDNDQNSHLRLSRDYKIVTFGGPSKSFSVILLPQAFSIQENLWCRVAKRPCSRKWFEHIGDIFQKVIHNNINPEIHQSIPLTPYVRVSIIIKYKSYLYCKYLISE